MQPDDQMARSRALVAALTRVLKAEVVETHLSWVLLGVDTAWKIKKPVRLPFVDYTELAARRHFCEEELRLNRRFAPALYLGVSRIGGSPELPEMDGRGEPLDYAVRMRRFAPGALFAELLAAARLEVQAIDRLAELIAGFQAEASRARPADGFGRPSLRREVALTALAGASALGSAPEDGQLQDWLEQEATALAPLWQARLEAGAVRDGHGDLHLENLLRLPDASVAAFDCIEFEAALRWIDVIDEIAFPVMDLGGRGRADLAFRLLNQWLDLTGEHAGLPALRFAVVYRALVRAQVLSLREPHGPAARRYFAHALAWSRSAAPRLVITHGLPGSGKTFESQRLLQREGAIRLRADVERKRLFGLGPLDHSAPRGLDLYTNAASARTYQQLHRLARIILQAGYPVVLDAGYLRREERLQARTLARELGVPFSILACEVDPARARERLQARRGDASEADVAVLEQLRSVAQPLTPQERAVATDGTNHGRPPG
jgi:aminoglycoside phosphotransferase family enzyme/predicted kinase